MRLKFSARLHLSSFLTLQAFFAVNARNEWNVAYKSITDRLSRIMGLVKLFRDSNPQKSHFKSTTFTIYKFKLYPLKTFKICRFNFVLLYLDKCDSYNKPIFVNIVFQKGCRYHVGEYLLANNCDLKDVLWCAKPFKWLCCSIILARYIIIVFQCNIGEQLY